MTRSSSCPGRTWLLVLFLQPFSHVYLAGQQIRNHSCFVRSPWCGTELITYPSKGTKCHREITLGFLTPDKTYPRNGRRMGTRSSPRSLLCPKWRASWYMISMQGLVWLSYLQQKRFVLLSSSPNCAFLLDGWFHLLRSKGLWNNGSHRHCYKLQLVCLYYIYVCMVMLLYWWVFTRTMQAVNRHRLYANERFC